MQPQWSYLHQCKITSHLFGLAGIKRRLSKETFTVNGWLIIVTDNSMDGKTPVDALPVPNNVKNSSFLDTFKTCAFLVESKTQETFRQESKTCIFNIRNDGSIGQNL